MKIEVDKEKLDALIETAQDCSRNCRSRFGKAFASALAALEPEPPPVTCRWCGRMMRLRKGCDLAWYECNTIGCGVKYRFGDTESAARAAVLELASREELRRIIAAGDELAEFSKTNRALNDWDSATRRFREGRI